MVANKKQEIYNEEEFEEELMESDRELNEEDEFIEEEEYETKSGDEPIYEGGPTIDQVADWKSKFDNEVYMSDFGKDTFIWRPLRRKEWKDMQKVQGQNEYYMEESICRTCVLWPENLSPQKMTFGKAGVPTMLSQLISEKSGFQRPATYKL